MKADLVQAIRAAVQPAVDSFTEQLVEMLATQAFESYETATKAALEIMRTALGSAAAPTEKPRRTRKKRRTRQVRAVAAPAQKRTARRGVEPSKVRPTCSRCGEAGHNARTCSLGVSLPEALDRQPGVAPAATSKPDRFAQIEAQAAARRAVQR